jgi:hypothetical protein
MRGEAPVKITGLKIESSESGRTVVEVWSKCSSVSDVDDLIAWLGLAKHVIRGWEKINAKNARAAKTPASKDEAAQQGEVQGRAQVPERPDGEHTRETTSTGE